MNIVNTYIVNWLRDEALPDIMQKDGDADVAAESSDVAFTKSSTFGEAEVGDITEW